MPTVADVLRRYGPEYLQRFESKMPAPQRKVLLSIMACRSGQLGTVHYRCAACGKTDVMGRSCGNRHCPSCQQQKAKAWLEKETQRLLPCPYFLITFTVPAEVREVVRKNPKLAYNALFQASSEALKKLASNPRHIGAKTLGFLGVLHTWGRDLGWKPHIHYVVPGGGLSADGQQWRPSRNDFFVPVYALSIIYRAKFRQAMERAGLLDQIDPAVWKQNWVVHSQAVGDGKASLKYLAPYVFRVAISDRRIVSCEEGKVTFSYRKSGTSHWRNMPLEAMEFIRRFLQHVLPAGFQKVRHYGFLHPHSSQSLESIQWLVAVHYQMLFLLLCVAHTVSAEPARNRCPHCGGVMVCIGFVPPAPPFLDSS